MEFDKSKVYTAVNADELKIGSKVFVKDCLSDLMSSVKGNDKCDLRILKNVLNADNEYRFSVESDDKTLCYALAYLVEPPPTLKWTDLKPGDVISLKYPDINVDKQCLVLEIRKKVQDEKEENYHVRIADGWLSDFMLAEYTKE